jgi:hypothetical protein
MRREQLAVLLASREYAGPAAGSTRQLVELALETQSGAGGDRRRRPPVNGADDFAAVDALEIDARDAEVGVLALDHDERDALVRHLDGVRVPELMLVPKSAQPPLSRSDGYAEAGEESLLGGCSRLGCVGISEVLEEFEERVGGSVAAGFGVEGFGAVDRLLLVAHVGVEVDVGGRDLFVSEP